MVFCREESSSDSEDSVSSNESLERYTIAGCWARDEWGLWPNGRRMGYQLRKGGRARHIFEPEVYQVRESPDEELRYVVVPNFLADTDIAAVHAAGSLPTAAQCEDRDDELEFHHVAHRFEGELRSSSRPLYRRLLGVMAWADQELWGSMGDVSQVFPEVEYIRYDGAPTSKEFAIDPHVDNRSLVTLVCLLSPQGSFQQGGISGFDPASDDQGDRWEKPQMGTAIIFRGEKLQHWVSPVTSGV
eukprot:CAMPEP_0115070932 /NCGR_PEP_ID=MMETSP0227-20121206/13393_1 /TAXON_ID=89957 /ORGANISM="Polarella glacialis, Strain CCMP 1383" /LENGTH=243 /DNA_ID=CAMNT_0002457511 /DNA_START=93 /DNA_END=822 /DNA_ORIENTATION=+